MITHKLTDDQYAQLFNPDTCVANFKKLQTQVSQRLSYIISQIETIVGRNYKWYDFDNEGGNERSPGSFDPQIYSNTIGITGEYINTNDFDNYDNEIPTSWLKDNFESRLKNEFAQFVAQEAKKKEEANATLNKNTIVAAQIFAKLNDEEKSLIVSPSFTRFQEQQRQEFHKKAKAEKLAEKQRVAQYHIARKKSLKQ